MSEANRTALGYIKESSAGTLPQNPVVQFIGYTGSPGLGPSIGSIASEEIRSDRQIADLILTSIEVTGSVNVELATDVHDPFLEGAFFNEIVRKGHFVRTDLSSANGDDITFNDSNHGVQVGDLILVDGDEANNGVKVVSAVANEVVTLTGFNATVLASEISLRVVGFEADTVTLDTTNKTISVDGLGRDFKLGEWIGFNSQVESERGFYRISEIETSGTSYTLHYDQSFTALNDAGENIFSALPTNKNRLVYGDYLYNGTQAQSFALVQKFESHDPVTVFRYRGIYIGSCEVSFSNQSIVGASFGVQGFNVVDDSIVVRTEREAQPSSKFSTGSDVIAFLLKGSNVARPNIIQNASLSINNNLRAQNGVGFIGAASIVAGTCEVTGTVEVFFGSKDIYEDALKNNDSSVMLSFHDSKNKRLLLFDCPRIKFSEGAPDVTAINTDVIASLGFQAILHEGFDHQVLNQTFWYL